MPIDVHAHAFIEAQRVARLATVDAAGHPHIVPICFALDRDVLYTPVDEKPKRANYRALGRLRNIEANPQVQVLFDVYDEDWSYLRYVQLRGHARIIDSGDEPAHAITLLRARYPQYKTMALERRPVIAVTVERTVAWVAAP